MEYKGQFKGIICHLNDQIGFGYITGELPSQFHEKIVFFLTKDVHHGSVKVGDAVEFSLNKGSDDYLRAKSVWLLNENGFRNHTSNEKPSYEKKPSNSFSEAKERITSDKDYAIFKPPLPAKPLISNIGYQTGSRRPDLVSEDDDGSKYVVETRHTGSLSGSFDYSESFSETSEENKSSNTEISVKKLIQRFSTKDKHMLAGKTSRSDDFIISNISSTTNLRKEDENGSGTLKSSTSIAISRPHSLASDFKSSLPGQISEGLHPKHPMAKTSTLSEDQNRDLSPKRPKKGRVVELKDHYGFDSFSEAKERIASDKDQAIFKPLLPAKPLTSNIGYQTGSRRPGLVSEDDDGSEYVVETRHTGSLSGSLDYSESLSETSGENKSSNTEISIKELIQGFSTKDKHMLAGKTSTSDDFIISHASSTTNLRKEDENGSGKLKSSTSIAISRPHSLASEFKFSLAGQTSERLHQKHPMAKTSTLSEDQDRDLSPKRPKKGRVVELKDHYGLDSFSEAKERIASDKDYTIFKPPLPAKPLTSNIGYQTGSGRSGLVSKDDDGSKYVVETRHTGSLSCSVDYSESLSGTSGENKSSNTEISIKELIQRFSTKGKHMLAGKTSTSDDFIILNRSSTMNLRKEEENGSGTLKSNTSIAISHSLSLASDFKSSFPGQISEGLHQKHPMAKTSTLSEDQDRDLSPNRPRKGRAVALRDHYGFIRHFANEMPPNFATKDVHFTKRAISSGDFKVNDEVEFQLDTRNGEKPSAKRIWSLKDINDNNQNDKDMKDETFGTIDRGISGGSKRRKSIKEDRLIKDEGNSVSDMENSTMDGQAEQLSLDQSSEKKSSSKYRVKQTDRADEMLEPLSRSRGNTSRQSNTQNRADSIGASMQQQIYGRICSLKDGYGFIRPSDKLPEDYPQSKDVHFYLNKLSCGFMPLSIGDEVEFTLGTKDKDRPMAIKLQITRFRRRNITEIRKYLHSVGEQLEDLKSNKEGITDGMKMDENAMLTSEFFVILLTCLPTWNCVFSCTDLNDKDVQLLLTLILEIEEYCPLEGIFQKAIKVISNSNFFSVTRGRFKDFIASSVQKNDMNSIMVIQAFLLMLLRYCPEKSRAVAKLVKPLASEGNCIGCKFMHNLLKEAAKMSTGDIADMAWEELPLVPSTEELLFSPLEGGNLEPIKKVGCYNSTEEYMDTYFRLLRADCFYALKKGIREMMSGAAGP